MVSWHDANSKNPHQIQVNLGPNSLAQSQRQMKYCFFNIVELLLMLTSSILLILFATSDRINYRSLVLILFTFFDIVIVDIVDIVFDIADIVCASDWISNIDIFEVFVDIVIVDFGNIVGGQ